MKEFTKEYSSLWGFGVTDVDAVRFIEKVKRAGCLENALPLVLTLSQSNSILEQLEKETTPDVQTGECPLCEAVIESMTLLDKFIKNSEVKGHPIPERFIKRTDELYNIFTRLDHRKETYLHPLTAKSRFNDYVNKNNQDIQALLNSFSYATESNTTVSGMTGVKDENVLVHEIAKKKFANAFVKLIDDSTPNTSYDPQTASEISNNINQVISLANTCTILESQRINSLGVSGSLRAILEQEASDDNTREVVANNEVPSQFTKLSEDVLTDLRSMVSDHEVERLTNGLYSKFINLLKYATVYAIGGAVSPVLAIMAIIVSMVMRDHTDAKLRAKLIRDLETELRVVQSKISTEEDKQKKYQLMRLESKMLHNIDRLQRKSAAAEFKANRNY